MKSRIKIALAVVLVFALAGFGIGIYLFNLEPEDLRKAEPDYILSATELQQAFETGEVSASEKYVNRIIEVSGIVASVNTGENNALNITLETGSGLSSIICTIPDAAAAADLIPGNEVTVRGECSGYLLDVLLNNCVLIK